MAEPLNDNSPMPFGKHKGKALVNVPGEYLYWLYLQNCDHQLLMAYLKENLKLLKIAYDQSKRHVKQIYK